MGEVNVGTRVVAGFMLLLALGAPTFQPDKLWNYKVGEKATLVGGCAPINAGVYDIQWSNIQFDGQQRRRQPDRKWRQCADQGEEASAAFKAVET